MFSRCALCVLLLGAAVHVDAQANPDYCTTADFPNTWGGWSEWTACNAIGPGLDGFQTQKGKCKLCWPQSCMQHYMRSVVVQPSDSGDHELKMIVFAYGCPGFSSKPLPIAATCLI